MVLSSSGSIAEKTKLVALHQAKTEKKSSMQKVKSYLQKRDNVNVTHNAVKIRATIKEMFLSKEIVNADGKEFTSVNKLFKLGPAKAKVKAKAKTPETNEMSAQKRKSIKMAEKKKRQNASKSKNAKSGPKSKKPKPTDESNDEYDDDEDVPPQKR